MPTATVARSLRENTWTSPLAREVGAGLAAAGLILLVVALRRGRAAVLALQAQAPGVTAGVHRRGLARALRAEALRVDGIRRAKVRVTSRAVVARTVSVLRDTDGLPAQVERRLQARIEELGLLRAPSVRVSVRRRTS